MPRMPNLIAGVTAGLFNNAEIGRWLGLILTGAAAGAEGLAKLDALDAELQAMVAEKRRPTPAEWASWSTRLDTAHDRIQRGGQ